MSSKKVNKKGKTRHAVKRTEKCEYFLEYEGKNQKMVLNCKDCKENYSIANPVCFVKILHTLSDTFMVDLLNMSNYLDTMYFGDSITLVKGIKELSERIKNYSIRKPQNQFKKTHPKRKGKIPCFSCNIHPGKLFEKLELNLNEDVEIFYSELRKNISGVRDKKDKATYCTTCRYQTLENLGEILQSFEELIAFVLDRAFKIVYRTS